jgi:hypothetical protein
VDGESGAGRKPSLIMHRNYTLGENNATSESKFQPRTARYAFQREQFVFGLPRKTHCICKLLILNVVIALSLQLKL